MQIFYDSGNSHVLFKEGTPANLYGVKTRKGPFKVGAVGNTSVWAGDEWACQMPTASGHREILVGLTVPQITAKFPYVSLNEAVKDLKDSDPSNVDLQHLSVPDAVGGECHVLLGIQYSALYPELVHQLECGLGIYKLRISSTSGYTATVAGPHHSFSLLASKVGNVSFLLSQFKEGVEYWRQCGAPAPKHVAMTDQELSSV